MRHAYATILSMHGDQSDMRTVRHKRHSHAIKNTRTHKPMCMNVPRPKIHPYTQDCADTVQKLIVYPITRRKCGMIPISAGVTAALICPCTLPAAPAMSTIAGSCKVLMLPSRLYSDKQVAYSLKPFYALLCSTIHKLHISQRSLTQQNIST
jgi:hypothetical protein